MTKTLAFNPIELIMALKSFTVESKNIYFNSKTFIRIVSKKVVSTFRQDHKMNGDGLGLEHLLFSFPRTPPTLKC
jgi:hypothetical protein